MAEGARLGQEDAARLGDPALLARRGLVWRLARQRDAVAGLVLILLLLVFCFIGPLLHPTDQLHTNLAITNLAPNGAHLLGTDGSGYDLLGRLMVGGRVTLEIALAVAVLATAFGVVWGAVAGKASSVSTTRIITASSQPPAKPATAPQTTPRAVARTATARAISSVTRPPTISRPSRS